MKKNKDFDAVEMMRSIRDKIQKSYEKNPESKKKRLNIIRKRYRIKSRKILSDT